MEQRLTELESRVAFQDDTIQKLNDVLIAQQEQLDKLLFDLRTLSDQVRTLGSDVVMDENQEPPPPHY
jgi:SlyX protein